MTSSAPSLVRYLNAFDAQVAYGGGDDPRPLLEPGHLYEVEKWDVLAWITLVTLRAAPDKRFNSVFFEVVT